MNLVKVSLLLALLLSGQAMAGDSNAKTAVGGGLGAAVTTFEAFDADNQSLGTIIADVRDDSFEGTVLEDRFFGVHHAGGILRITIRADVENLEVDHVQSGFAPAPGPLPAGVWLLVSGLGLLRVRRAA